MLFLGEIGLKYIACRDKGAEFVGEYKLLFFSKHRGYVGVVVEMVAQLLINGFKHPVTGLLPAFDVKIAVGSDEVKIAVNHIPNFGYAEFKVAGVG